MMNRFTWLTVALMGSLSFMGFTPAPWDTCTGPSATDGTSANGTYKVSMPGIRIDVSEGKPIRFLLHKNNKEIAKGELPALVHPHLSAWVTNDGSSFAVINENAGPGDKNSALLYKSDGSLTRALGLKDILGNEEDRVGQSISHFFWLKEITMDDGKGELVLKTRWDSTIRISMKDGKVSR